MLITSQEVRQMEFYSLAVKLWKMNERVQRSHYVLQRVSKSP